LFAADELKRYIISAGRKKYRHRNQDFRIEQIDFRITAKHDPATSVLGKTALCCLEVRILK